MPLNNPSSSVDVTDIKSVTDLIPNGGAMTDIGNDTARLTSDRASALTDWLNGERLDLILDEILSNMGDPSDAGSLALLASLFALARKAAKEAWEAEHHLHNRERWYGAGASKTLKLASKTPFALAGADDDWGVWTVLLVPTDTPAISGSTHFDLHRIEYEDVQGDASKKSSRFQIAWDTAVDGQADAITNGTYTEWITSPEKDGKAEPVDIIMQRLATNTYYVWVRYWCLDEDSTGSDTKIFIGSHEYTDPDV